MDKFYCEGCDKEISWPMARTTMNRFRKYLCYDCQIAEIMATYPPKMATIAIKRLQDYRNGLG